MKYWLTLFFTISLFISHSQNIKGNWYGIVDTTDGAARMVVTFYNEEDKDKSYIISPEFFGPFAIHFDSISKQKNKFVLSKKTGLKIFGNIINDTLITGMFKNDFPPIYRRISLKKVTFFPDLSKPQTPNPPFPYNSKLVFFKDSMTGMGYRGALTIPRDSLKSSRFPAIILLPGTGTHNMDYQSGGHSLFMVLADHFTRKGYVVLRKDSRFYGDTSKSFENVTLPETVADAEAALRFLKKQPNIDTARIGVLGHSEGGIVAPALAAKNPEVKFLVLMGAPGIPFRKVVIEQRKRFLKENLMPDFFPNISPDSLKAFTPRIKYLFEYNPAESLTKLTIPILALNGDKDLQVNAEQNIAAIDSALKVGGNKNYQTYILPGINHNFQKCVKCTFREGVYLEETISPDVMKLIVDWLNKNIK